MTLLAVTVTVVLVWTVVVGRFLGRTYSAPGPSSAPVPPAPVPLDASWPTDVQILFAEHADRTLLLDCVVLDGDPSGVPAGTPVALHLTEPASPPIAALVDSTVDAWAEGSEVVDLELRWRARGTRAHLSDGTRSMNLDVELARST